MTAFSYPKNRHTRTKNPPFQKSYKAYKGDLREEFQRRCVYCCIPDTLSSSGSAGFHIDHYKPKKLFPSLESDYGNLFYACARCNVAKGAYWPVTPEAIKTQFIPNPCDHRMFDHLRFNDERVVAHSQVGKWTIDYLDLNEDRSLRFRADSLVTLKCLEQQISEFESVEKNLQKKIASSGGDNKKLELFLDQVRVNLNKLRAARDRHYGIGP